MNEPVRYRFARRSERFEPYAFMLAWPVLWFGPPLGLWVWLVVFLPDIFNTAIVLEALKDSYSGPMSFMDYIEIARDSYRNSAPEEALHYLAPGAGLPSEATKRVSKRLASFWEGTPERIDFEWGSIEDDRFFEVDRDARVI